MQPLRWRIRDADDADSGQVMRLIGSVYAEYPGCVLDLAEWDADLLSPASALAAKAGRLWVAEDESGRIIGCGGFARHPSGVEIKRLYVDMAARGQGIAKHLLKLIANEAKLAGAGEIIAWSDTRFTTAHAMYKRQGFTQLPQQRELHDPSNTVEYCFAKRNF